MFSTILCIILLFFIVIGLLSYKSFICPLVAFNAIWLAVFLLLQINITPFILQVDFNSFFMFLIMILFFNITSIMYALKRQLEYKRYNLRKNINNITDYSSILFSVFMLWLFCVFIEICYSKGLPLFWALKGINRTYADFGIPTLHGLLNSLSWVLVATSFSLLLDLPYKRKRLLFVIVLTFFIYIMLLARQALTTHLVHIVCIYLYKRKFNLIKIFLYVALFVLAFGLLGNIRTGYEFLLQRARINIGYVPWIFAGIIWVYMYITTPVSNFIFLISSFKDDFMYGNAMMTSLLPSVLRKLFLGEDAMKSISHQYLINETFNVSTFLMIPYYDWGIFGVAFIAIIYAAVSSGLWPKERMVSKIYLERSIVCYAMIFQILIMSFFVNMMFMLPFLMQFIFVYFLFKYIRIKTH